MKAYRELTEFGKWVKIRLIEKNMTATELAKQVGTTKNRISEIIRGVIAGEKYIDAIKNVLGNDKKAG